MVGVKGGPTKHDVEELHRWPEGEYMCGSKVPGDKFYVQKNFFKVTILSHNIIIILVGRKQRILAKDAD